MKIIEIDTTQRRQVKQFVDLPFHLYAGISQWVPPLEMDIRQALNRKRHPFYQHGAAAFFLAFDNDRPEGRLAVIENENFNRFHQERTAFFYFFECQNKPSLAQALFEAGSAWARQRGLERVIGPKGLTVFDGTGLLVSGFEHRPAFGQMYNPPHYPALLEAAGFSPMRDLVSGYLDEKIQFPAKIHELAELLMKRRGLHVARYKTRQDLRALVPYLKNLYNASLGGTEANTPLTDEDAKGMGEQLIWFADPSLIKIVMKGDQPVGFLFAYPDVSAAIQRTRGKILPLGWIWLLRELRRTKWININGAGMAEGYRGLGGTALLFSEMFKSVAESRYRYADLVQIGTENINMQRELHELGVDFYKMHRIYERRL